MLNLFVLGFLASDGSLVGPFDFEKDFPATYA